MKYRRVKYVPPVESLRALGDIARKVGGVEEYILASAMISMVDEALEDVDLPQDVKDKIAAKLIDASWKLATYIRELGKRRVETAAIIAKQSLLSSSSPAGSEPAGG